MGAEGQNKSKTKKKLQRVFVCKVQKHWSTVTSPSIIITIYYVILRVDVNGSFVSESSISMIRKMPIGACRNKAP